MNKLNPYSGTFTPIQNSDIPEHEIPSPILNNNTFLESDLMKIKSACGCCGKFGHYQYHYVTNHVIDPMKIRDVIINIDLDGCIANRVYYLGICDKCEIEQRLKLEPHITYRFCVLCNQHEKRERICPIGAQKFVVFDMGHL